ncbi:MAG: hypothetical protein M3O36_06905 [Myxococcota bacterium]|nr:hypothetical protein [Myxococcota bacterium]
MKGPRARGPGVILRVAAALVLTAAANARADGVTPRTPPDGSAPVDRTVVRFYSPETGGAAQPRFVLERTLAFEARLSAMAQQREGTGGGYQDREVRDALDHHVAEEMLASLGNHLITDSPADKRPSHEELARVDRDIEAALLERLGGRARVEEAARAEQIEGAEIDRVLARQARAAWYLDRTVTPILHPSEEQLRDVFRSSVHPYRGQRFDDVRAALERWFVIERLRVAEIAFLQGARSRVRSIVTK